jgi:predicted TIM-barrel fold metal-dependent hydrolase
MKKHNVYGVLSGKLHSVQQWMDNHPNRFIPATHFELEVDGISPDSLRSLILTGEIEVFGEIGNAYYGIAPNASQMEPYWKLAEQLNVPVGIHVGGSPPGEPYVGNGARSRLESPLTLEEVLIDHPRLRLYIMHAGYPMLDDLINLLHMHPQVYVEVGAIVFAKPRPAFYRYLRNIVEAGFVNRIMFGSDQMVWPEAIERSINTIQEAPFLTKQQKADIFYNNAARFLQISKKEGAPYR